MNVSHTDTGYCCNCDIIPGWVVAGSDNFEKFKKEVQESVDFWLLSCREDGEPYPKVFDGEYHIMYKFDVASLLSLYRGVFTFRGLQNITGINQKQLCHYAAGISKPRTKQAVKIVDGLHRLADELKTVTV